MEDIKLGWLYISADGDGIGRLVGRAVIANDVKELHSVSNRIDAAQDFILHWCKDVGGTKISGGGDEFTAAIPPEAKDKLGDLRTSIEKAFGYTITVGVGRSLSEAGTALLVGKLRGKNRIVWFNKKIKEDIKKAKRRVREKRATPDEYKLSEAYLEKGEVMGKMCGLHKSENHRSHVHVLMKHEEGFHGGAADKEGKAPANPDAEDNRSDDCAYCQDLDAVENADGTAGMHDCDACKEYDASQQNTGGIDLDNCPYCQEYDSLHGSNSDGCPMCQQMDAAQDTKEASDLENISGSQDYPQDFQGGDHVCNCPYCNANKDQTNVAVEDMAAERPEDCPECQKMYADAIENQKGQTGQEDPNMQGHETAEEVLDLLDQEPGKGESPAQEAKKIDNTEMPQGDQMKEGTSVKDNFGPAQKQDISDADQSFKEHTCNCPDCASNNVPADSTQEAALGANPQLSQDPAQDPSQDQPDMTSVLQSGLDDHAQDQKKQQVLDMVGQTLAGFKANKESLEATKEQNQALYNSCIQMLKSMIALCDLLGLKPQATPAPEQPAQASTPQQTPAQPPKAAPGEGAAQAPKEKGQAA